MRIKRSKFGDERFNSIQVNSYKFISNTFSFSGNMMKFRERIISEDQVTSSDSAFRVGQETLQRPFRI